MVLELATVLLGAIVGAVAVVYVVSKGYFGRKKKESAAVKSQESYTPAAEHEPEHPTETKVQESPAPEAFSMFESTPSPAPAFYESVQPAPAPVTYAAPSITSFGAPSLTKKPTRTYRRRTAPVRSTAGAKAAKPKPKKS